MDKVKAFPALACAAEFAHNRAAACDTECAEWDFEHCPSIECKQARQELQAARELLADMRGIADITGGGPCGLCCEGCATEFLIAVNLAKDAISRCQPQEKRR